MLFLIDAADVPSVASIISSASADRRLAPQPAEIPLVVFGGVRDVIAQATDESRAKQRAET